MYEFQRLQNAASFALRCAPPAFVFDGPGPGGANYVVAIGREARELEANGLEAYSLRQTARAARGEPVAEEGE